MMVIKPFIIMIHVSEKAPFLSFSGSPVYMFRYRTRLFQLKFMYQVAARWKICVVDSPMIKNKKKSFFFPCLSSSFVSRPNHRLTKCSGGDDDYLSAMKGGSGNSGEKNAGSLVRVKTSASPSLTQTIKKKGRNIKKTHADKYFEIRRVTSTFLYSIDVNNIKAAVVISILIADGVRWPKISITIPHLDRDCLL